MLLEALLPVHLLVIGLYLIDIVSCFLLSKLTIKDLDALGHVGEVGDLVAIWGNVVKGADRVSLLVEAMLFYRLLPGHHLGRLQDCLLLLVVVRLLQAYERLTDKVGACAAVYPRWNRRCCLSILL